MLTSRRPSFICGLLTSSRPSSTSLLTPHCLATKHAHPARLSGIELSEGTESEPSVLTSPSHWPRSRSCTWLYQRKQIVKIVENEYLMPRIPRQNRSVK